MSDNRPLHVRVKALANRFDAIAMGHDKNTQMIPEAGAQAWRDAQTLHEAAIQLLR